MHIFFRFDCCSLLYLLFYKSRICKKGSGGFLIKETVFFLHTDHIGSSALVTTETGAKYQEIEYRAFGELHSKWQNDVWNLWNESDDFGDIGSYLFTGQQYDSETGLYYYGARYYDPFIGRFISPDSVVDDALDSQGYNRYSYCKNNPVVYGDPSGNRKAFRILAALAAFIIPIIATLAPIAPLAITVAVSALTGLIASTPYVGIAREANESKEQREYAKHIQETIKNDENTKDAGEAEVTIEFKEINEDKYGAVFIEKFSEDGVYVIEQGGDTGGEHSQVLLIWTDPRSGRRMFYFTELIGSVNFESITKAVTVGFKDYTVKSFSGYFEITNTEKYYETSSGGFDQFWTHYKYYHDHEGAGQRKAQRLDVDTNKTDMFVATKNIEEARQEWEEKKPLYLGLEMWCHDYSHYMIVSGFGKGIWQNLNLTSAKIEGNK